MQIYNTMTRKKEALETNVPGQVDIYPAGPRVQHFHIGNCAAPSSS